VKLNSSQSVLLLLALSAFSSEIKEPSQQNGKSEAVVSAENGYAHTEPNTRQSSGSPCFNEYRLTAFNDEV
jgi:hypothetical protein